MIKLPYFQTNPSILRVVLWCKFSAILWDSGLLSHHVGAIEDLENLGTLDFFCGLENHTKIYENYPLVMTNIARENHHF